MALAFTLLPVRKLSARTGNVMFLSGQKGCARLLITC